MNAATEEFVIHEFGWGVHHSNAPKAEDRYAAGYDNIAAVMRARVEEMLLNEDIDIVDRDILGAAIAELTPHNWKMAAIHLFNTKETQ